MPVSQAEEMARFRLISLTSDENSAETAIRFGSSFQNGHRKEGNRANKMGRELAEFRNQ
ncbi:hypothetical protein BaRGS_00015992, partial [Batillaria attramentaria]